MTASKHGTHRYKTAENIMTASKHSNLIVNYTDLYTRWYSLHMTASKVLTTKYYQISIRRWGSFTRKLRIIYNDSKCKMYYRILHKQLQKVNKHLEIYS